MEVDGSPVCRGIWSPRECIMICHDISIVVIDDVCMVVDSLKLPSGESR